MPERRRGRRRWRQAALLLGSLAAGCALLAVWLFSGSAVRCAAAEDPSRPALRCVFDVAASCDAVWSELTRTDEPRPYFFDAVLEAEMRTGGRWRFVTEDRSRLLAEGEILELDAPRRFVQSFRAADLDDAASRVAVELGDRQGGCAVELVHDRFRRETTTYRRFRRAHPLALSALQALLETGRLPPRARVYTVLFKPGMNAVSARAEPWEKSSP